MIGAEACSSPSELAFTCPDMLVRSIVVEIRDSATAAPLALNARGVVRDGAYVDSLLLGARLTADPATTYERYTFSRPGTYTVEISLDGYQRWSRSNVRVEKANCGVETQHLSAKLVPLS